MVLRQIFDRLIISGVLIASAFLYEAIPVLICGILVGGSIIPIAIGAYRRKSRGGRLETLIDEKLSDLEERLVERMADMEFRNAQLVEAVEERVDFAQQLMARGVDPEPERPMGLPIVKPVRVGRYK